MNLRIDRLLILAILLAPATFAVSVAHGQSETRSLPAIKSRAEFDSLGVVYDAGDAVRIAARDVRHRSAEQEPHLLRQFEALQVSQGLRQRHLSLA